MPWNYIGIDLSKARLDINDPHTVRDGARPNTTAAMRGFLAGLAPDDVLVLESTSVATGRCCGSPPGPAGAARRRWSASIPGRAKPRLVRLGLSPPHSGPCLSSPARWSPGRR
jgi:hypothetical protein